MAPKYLKHWKEFIGAQKDWQSNTKYGKPVLVKGGVPSIILCNSDMSYKDYLEEEANRKLLDWTNKNAVFITLQEAMFSNSNSAEQQAGSHTGSDMWAADSRPADAALQMSSPRSASLRSGDQQHPDEHSGFSNHDPDDYAHDAVPPE